MNHGVVAGAAGVAVYLAVVAFIYNRLVRLRYAARSAWSDIDVHLKKRHELLPALVETVAGYAAHERAALTGLSEARGAAMKARTPADRRRTERGLSGALHVLLAVVEAYPELKADAHFRDLMGRLAGLEDNIEYARRYYNAAVRDYNIAAGVFPSNVVAAALSFAPEDFFELDDPGEERRAGKVAFRGPRPEEDGGQGRGAISPRAR